MILPSFSENYGLVAAEALSFGIPVIATKGTPWSILDRDRSGWWVDSDTDSLAEAIIDMAKKTPAELQKMGWRGRAYVASSLTWKVCAKDMYALYDSIVTDFIA